jgi:hypothetical protein
MYLDIMKNIISDIIKNNFKKISNFTFAFIIDIKQICKARFYSMLSNNSKNNYNNNNNNKISNDDGDSDDHTEMLMIIMTARMIIFVI